MRQSVFALRWAPLSALLVVSLAIALLAAMPAPAAHAQEAPTRVVDPGGSDSAPGTPEQPWRTIQHGLRNVQPGEELLIRNGTYTEDLSSVPYRARATTPSARIRVANWPGHTPVIVGQLHIRDASWWTFEGLTVRWPSNPRSPGEPLVKLMGGRGWVFHDNEVHDAIAYAGVYIGVSTETGSPADWTLRSNCIRNTRDSGREGNTDHNLYIQNGLRAGHGLIEGNLFFAAPHGTNIKLGSGSGSSAPSASNVTIRYNTLFDAAQNLLAEHDVADVLIERNIIGRITDRPQLLGNLRGNGNKTGTVVARDNVAWWASRFIANTIEGQTTASPQGIVDGGGNRFGQDPRFDGVSSCGQFAPNDGAALAYGHRARTERVSGASRAATAVALSREARPGRTTRTALIARADAYPDALAGAPLAEKLDAPLLLTNGARLDAEVAEELLRLNVRDVVVLGGKAAISDDVVRQLGKLPSVQGVRRISGPDRFQTARLIGAEVGGSQVYVVEGISRDPGRGWPDAVSVSALAARQQRPILLVTSGSIPEGTRAALGDLGAKQATIIGGTGAVSAAVEGELRSAMGDGARVDRVAGSTRYATSVKVADLALADGASGERVFIATGMNWPDALAAGPTAAATGGVLVLAAGTVPDATKDTQQFLQRVVPVGAQASVVGGRGAIINPTEDRLAAAVPPR